ncbi:rplD [Symbiodinium pilosum]|uniref:Large ribosomal subunit protein uL4m n=1 Tax=Symbiodinium pilosum TaxID=2952 RepID=A0A812WXA0_SYMPI|nr:rplD [Symbiodinium pilosum]
MGAMRALRSLSLRSVSLGRVQDIRPSTCVCLRKFSGLADEGGGLPSSMTGTVKPGETADIATVIRNWWAFPAVGFGSCLELPVHQFEVLGTETKSLGSVVVPNSIFGLPIRKDLIFKAYWYHRRKLAGYQDTMQLYKWEWPGANRKVRSQKKSGKGRMGRRKAPGRFEGVHCHALRPRDWGNTKLNSRVLWRAVRCMLSVKFVQNSIKVVDSFNLQSHKTKHLVQHLRRLLGHRCHSALLVHEGNFDVNDNCRWASAHIPAIRRENVEGLSVYNLLKYHEVVITEAALAKLLKEIFLFPRKRGWIQRYATPDRTRAPVPEKVPGWNRAWVEKKERIRNSEFRAREFFQESLKWKWSSDLKGPLKVPRTDALSGFRVKDFLLAPEAPAWEKLESLYGDEEPLEELEDEEFEELTGNLDALRERGEAKSNILDRPEVAQKGLHQLAQLAQTRKS